MFLSYTEENEYKISQSTILDNTKVNNYKKKYPLW